VGEDKGVGVAYSATHQIRRHHITETKSTHLSPTNSNGEMSEVKLGDGESHQGKQGDTVAYVDTVSLGGVESNCTAITV
jgi:hypothetical protein